MTPKQQHFTRLCAQLEPAALEPLKSGAFSYSVPQGQSRLVLHAFNCNKDGARLDIRQHCGEMLMLSGNTVTGSGDCYLVTVNPPAYDDPEDLYYERMAELQTIPLRSTGVMYRGNAAYLPFLPAPYGIIIVNQTFLNYAWFGGPGFGSDEQDDTNTMRLGHHSGYAPARKGVGRDCTNCLPTTGDGWGIHYHVLPASWSKVLDPVSSSYVFHDDFMGAALDTDIWNVVQTSPGSVRIDPRFQWVSITGNDTWNGNSAVVKQPFNTGKTLVVDVNNPVGMGLWGSNLVIGWFSSIMPSVIPPTAHTIHFSGSQLYRSESSPFGTNGPFGVSYTDGWTYRFKITTEGDYFVQGGPEFPPIGGAVWRQLPSVPSIPNVPLYPGVMRHTNNNAPCFVSDVRIY